jgi:hypothetical protein
MTPYDRLGNRTLPQFAVNAIARRFHALFAIVRAAGNRQTPGHSGGPSGVRFTITRNEGLSIETG